jgi:hypothetical protein
MYMWKITYNDHKACCIDEKYNLLLIMALHNTMPNTVDVVLRTERNLSSLITTPDNTRFVSSHAVF